jgi:metallo-beta-lactamase family protein
VLPVFVASPMAVDALEFYSNRPDELDDDVVVRFQAEGTRGRQLVDGARTVKIHGAQVPVAARVEQLDSMSALADPREILRWLHGFTRPSRTTYLVHGEPRPMATLERVIATELGWPVHMPTLGERVEL